MVALYRLFKAMNRVETLKECYDLLVEFEASVSKEHGESMRTGVAIYREIHEEWNVLAADR